MRLACMMAVMSGLAGIAAAAQPHGIDISHYQPAVNFAQVKANGVSFVFIKATEGARSIDPEYNQYHTGATNAGLIRGAYHFARPDVSGGAEQAKHFLAHGGGWSGDGRTLPGALDIEYNPSGAECYGLSAAAMVTWIRDFSNTYEAKTSRPPIIYTTTGWWRTCTGNYAGFGNSPLWIARYGSSIGHLPAGWTFTTFWQYADRGPNPGNQDLFNGDLAGLHKFAGN